MSVLSLTGGLAMDLGTANTLIYERGRGIILNEPSVVALEVDTRRVLAVGHEAKSYLGRTPTGIEVIRPLKSGVISDFAVTQQMIKSFLEMAGANRRLFKPRIVVGVPSGSPRWKSGPSSRPPNRPGANPSIWSTNPWPRPSDWGWM